MTIVFQETFGGAGAWDTAKWATSSSGTTTFDQTGGYGRITTPAAGSYNDKIQARTTTSLTGGEYRYDFTVDVKDTDYLVSVHAAVSGEAPVNWTWAPQHGYAVRYDPPSGATTLFRVNNYTVTSLGTATVTNVVGDVIHFALRPGTGLFVWKNAVARPASPTIASADAAFTSGFGGIGYQGGGAATSRTLRFDNVALDDLAAPPTAATLRLGSGSVALRVGAAAASKAYIGSTQVWP